MNNAVEKLKTIYDIEALPDDERVELVDGVIYDMASPNWIHQQLVLNLSSSILTHIRDHQGKCQVGIAPFAVYLNDDDYNYFEPDILVVCDPEKLKDKKACHGAPDWIIEIASDSTRYRDYMVKSAKYKAAGVREYWIVDPLDDTVTVYDFEHETMDKYSFTDSIAGKVLQGLSIRVNDAEQINETDRK